LKRELLLSMFLPGYRWCLAVSAAAYQKREVLHGKRRLLLPEMHAAEMHAASQKRGGGGKPS